MRSTVYLYGIQPEEFIHLNYIDAIRYKLSKGTELYEKLYTLENQGYANGSTYDDLKELRERSKAVYKAIEHNRKLLREVNINE